MNDNIRYSCLVSLLKVKLYSVKLLVKHTCSYVGCLPGYSGLNCSFPCPYPLYGVECQQSCNCVEDLCDVSKGCISYNQG